MNQISHRLYFRADGNELIGLGHLTRVLALVEMTRQKFSPLLFVNNPTDQVRLMLLDAACEYVELDFEKSKEQELKHVLAHSDVPGVFVLDGYSFNDSYFKILKKQGHQVVYFDDFGKDYKYVDAIINHAMGANKLQYKLRNKLFLLSNEHVVLRKAFIINCKKEKVWNGGRTLFICFGGSDRHNLTLTALKTFGEISIFEQIHVVLAPTFSFKEEIQTYAASIESEVHLHTSLSSEEMATLMLQCDFAFAPTSNLSYEICASKMIFFGGYYEENQRMIHDGLVSKGCIFSLGDLSLVTGEGIINKVLETLENKEDMDMQIINQQREFSGDSPLRIVKALQRLDDKIIRN